MVHIHYSPADQHLQPLVGVRLVIVSEGLERAYRRARNLDEMGYRVGACGDPDRAAGFVKEYSPDAVIVDLEKPRSPSAEIAGEIRSASNAPLLVIGTTGDLDEMTRCFEAGADDYCSPRATTREIDLRLRAMFRRFAREVADDGEDDAGVFRVGDLEIDMGGRTVRKRGKIVQLSPTEFRLLMTLAEHAGDVVPSKALIARVWGDQYAGETHYLRLYVRYLRQKIEDDPSEPHYIVNRWGSGYALETPREAA
ncbi:MAG: response regulator transcription factor [Dehalococcoidia bacterium]|nr:response regulator transcription factor [Dehalococcoidia bacterium]MCA9845031.1 response regulator transcription factor [Dehalococcoidia bacterium]